MNDQLHTDARAAAAADYDVESYDRVSFFFPGWETYRIRKLLTVVWGKSVRPMRGSMASSISALSPTNWAIPMVSSTPTYGR